jgi:hypothetical protein
MQEPPGRRDIPKTIGAGYRRHFNGLPPVKRRRPELTASTVSCALDTPAMTGEHFIALVPRAIGEERGNTVGVIADPWLPPQL